MAQLKRLVAPEWPIERKVKKFIVPPMPGPHPILYSMPLGVILRDVLKYAKTMKEAEFILKKGLVSVDGVRRKSKNFPAGLMDILNVGKDSYRIMPDAKGFRLQKISASEAGFKLLKIRGKTTLRGKKTQINFHDGKNIITDSSDLKTGDIVVFDLGKKAIKERIRLDKGSMVFVIRGRSRGLVGKIDDIKTTRSPKPNEVLVSIGSSKIVLPKDYIFVIGHDKPVINLGE